MFTYVFFVCSSVHVHMKTRGGCWMFSCIALHIIFEISSLADHGVSCLANKHRVSIGVPSMLGLQMYLPGSYLKAGNLNSLPAFEEFLVFFFFPPFPPKNNQHVYSERLPIQRNRV